jgi:hypothetical protein
MYRPAGGHGAHSARVARPGRSLRPGADHFASGGAVRKEVPPPRVTFPPALLSRPPSSWQASSGHGLELGGAAMPGGLQYPSSSQCCA